jgi:hypothetical protein
LAELSLGLKGFAGHDPATNEPYRIDRDSTVTCATVRTHSVLPIGDGIAGIPFAGITIATWPIARVGYACEK